MNKQLRFASSLGNGSLSLSVCHTVLPLRNNLSFLYLVCDRFPPLCIVHSILSTRVCLYGQLFPSVGFPQVLTAQSCLTEQWLRPKMDQNQMFQNQDAPAQIPTGDSGRALHRRGGTRIFPILSHVTTADIPIKMSPDTFQHQNKHRDACQSMSIFPQDAMTWEDDPRTRSQSPLGNEASMASFDEADPSFNVGNGLRRMDNNSNNNPSHFINEWHMARPPPSVGFAPLQAEHPSACTQHFHAQGDVPMGGPPCTCMSSYPPSQVPPAVPTPPPSDGSGPLSPHMTGDWLPFTASGVDPNLPKQIRLSQCVSSNSPILRPDGVRKKNAKFEIPEDRNLDTLDALIKHAKNDAELKELKMQKRLLRNREAAYEPFHLLVDSAIVGPSSHLPRNTSS